MYRDCVRDFWRGSCGLGEFAERFTGSSDLYQSDGRRPFASINFVTAHDGFTLADLVSYNEKHNEANLEENRDEVARTQRGNNNAYCQDNEISWFDWELDERRQRLLDFTRRLVHFRLAHPLFRRTQFLTGEAPLGSGLPDSWWFRPDGRKMTRRDWADAELRTVGLFLNGEEIPAQTRQGEQVVDETFVVLFNAHPDPVAFRLPPRRFGQRWK